jgi:hypothetical protein
MKPTIYLLLVLSGIVVPCPAVKRVTAAQLEQLATSLHGKPDADLAYQIGDLELTERLSPKRIARLGAAFPGEKSRQALPGLPPLPSFRLPRLRKSRTPPHPILPPCGGSLVWLPTR